MCNTGLLNRILRVRGECAGTSGPMNTVEVLHRKRRAKLILISSDVCFCAAEIPRRRAGFNAIEGAQEGAEPFAIGSMLRHGADLAKPRIKHRISFGRLGFISFQS